MILPTFGVWVRMKKHGRTRTGCMNLDFCTWSVEQEFGGFPILGVPLGGPYNQDDHMLGSVLGSPYFGKLPVVHIHYIPSIPSNSPSYPHH